jgi:N-acetylglucosaminyldiphosphoundecaprenol N-acetyl-beta-D-mannosaminyltransferase
MVVAARRFGGLDVQRAAFDLSSIAGPVLRWLETGALPVILVGGKKGVADSAAQKLMTLFPTLRISGTFTGFAPGPEEATSYLLENPDTTVICGMGAPVQERFLLELKPAGWRGIGLTCGGFFDQLNTRLDYYPRWIDAMNLRFVYRLYREPRRLARRYLVEYQVFMKLFLKEYICGNRHP